MSHYDDFKNLIIDEDDFTNDQLAERIDSKVAQLKNLFIEIHSLASSFKLPVLKNISDLDAYEADIPPPTFEDAQIIQIINELTQEKQKGRISAGDKKILDDIIKLATSVLKELSPVINHSDNTEFSYKEPVKENQKSTTLVFTKEEVPPLSAKTSHLQAGLIKRKKHEETNNVSGASPEILHIQTQLHALLKETKAEIEIKKIPALINELALELRKEAITHYQHVIKQTDFLIDKTESVNESRQLEYQINTVKKGFVLFDALAITALQSIDYLFNKTSGMSVANPETLKLLLSAKLIERTVSKSYESLANLDFSKNQEGVLRSAYTQLYSVLSSELQKLTISVPGTLSLGFLKKKDETAHKAISNILNDNKHEIFYHNSVATLEEFPTMRPIK